MLLVENIQFFIPISIWKPIMAGEWCPKNPVFGQNFEFWSSDRGSQRVQICKIWYVWLTNESVQKRTQMVLSLSNQGFSLLDRDLVYEYGSFSTKKNIITFRECLNFYPTNRFSFKIRKWVNFINLYQIVLHRMNWTFEISLNRDHIQFISFIHLWFQTFIRHRTPGPSTKLGRPSKRWCRRQIKLKGS